MPEPDATDPIAIDPKFLLSTSISCCQSAGHRADPAPAVLPCKLAPGATLPTRGRVNDAGLDLYAPESFVLKPGEFRKVDTGVSVAIPPGHCGQIWGRSSLGLLGLGILGGLIDEEFRGPIGVILVNHYWDEIRVKAGERIAQLVVSPVAYVAPMAIGDLGETARGGDGWGSSGR